MSRSDRTKARILGAVVDRLTAHPATPPAMGAIAARAGVTRQLLYVHFENRTALLLELSRQLDAEARTPELQATIDDAPDALSALRAAVRVQARIKPQVIGLATSLERLAHDDEDAALACREREEARLGRCRAVVDRLGSEGMLASGWTPRAAAELMWSMTSHHAWQELVHERGWSSTTWTRRTTAALEAAIVTAG